MAPHQPPQSKSLRLLFSTYGEWIYRLIVVIGFVAVLWLNQNYVTKTDFSTQFTDLRNDLTTMSQQINSRIDVLSSSINAANTAIAVAQQRQSEIVDLKERLRDLERELRERRAQPIVP